MKIKECGCIVHNEKIYQCDYHQNEMYVAFGIIKKNPIPKPKTEKEK